MAGIHKIDQDQYDQLKLMLCDQESVEMAVEILKNADRTDWLTNHYVKCLASMYIPNNYLFNPSAKIIKEK